MNLLEKLDAFLYWFFSWLLKRIKIENLLYGLINAYEKEAKSTPKPYDDWIVRGLHIFLYMITGKPDPTPDEVVIPAWQQKIYDWVKEKHSMEMAIFTAINAWQKNAKENDTQIDDWALEGLEGFYEALVGHKNPLDVDEGQFSYTTPK